MSVLFVKIPRYLNGGNIRLRPMRIFDGPSMNEGLKDKDILKATGLTGPVVKSWFSVWRWFKRTYVILYCIEVDSTCIGFIGLYNLKPDKSAWMSLAIFNDRNRRSGYGTEAFNLLAQSLKRYSLRINVKVERSNNASILFLIKLGFVEVDNLNDVKVMSIDLKKF